MTPGGHRVCPSASTRTTTRGCAVANHTGRRGRPGARHVRGDPRMWERTGSATTCSPASRTCKLKLGFDCLGEDLLQATPIAHQDLRDHQHLRSRASRTWARARSPTRPDSTRPRSGGPGHVPAHRGREECGQRQHARLRHGGAAASIELKARELGVSVSGRPDAVANVTQKVKEAEAMGYTYDAADASFELLLREGSTVTAPATSTSSLGGRRWRSAQGSRATASPRPP